MVLRFWRSFRKPIVYGGTVVCSGVVTVISVFKGLCFAPASPQPRKFKLHAQYFTKAVASFIVGFPCEKRVMNGFKWCQFCRQDLLTDNRGLYVSKEHWKSEDYQLVEMRHRLANGLPLLKKACELGGAAECAKKRALLTGLHQVSMEFIFGITVE